MDLNIKGLDDDVARRLREQAAAEGVSVQQYVRDRLARIASRPSPAEFGRLTKPLNRKEFEAIRDKLRRADAG